MSSFLHPAFLWGLLGLSIPIAIHLLSRKEGKIIKVGSLRHLRTSESPTFKSLKINELLLLAVRCLLLIVLVLFISEWMVPNWWKTEDEKWVLVDPVIEVDAALEKVLDSLVADGHELRSLVKGFPPIDETNKTSQYDYWSLVEDLGKRQNTEMIVFSGNQFQKFDGKRPSLPTNVRWVSLPVSENEFVTEAIRLNELEVQVRKAKTRASGTTFEYTKQATLPGDKYVHAGEDSVLIENPDTIRIRMVADDKYRYDKKVILAALQTINTATLVELGIQEGNPEPQDDWVFWLSDDIPPAISNVIFYKTEEVAPLLSQVGNTKWQITKRINQKVASDNQLTTTLFELIIPVKKRNMILEKDKRVMAEGMLWSSNNQSLRPKVAGISSDQKILIVLGLILFLMERALAFVRRL